MKEDLRPMIRALAILALTASPAIADLRVDFREGAPKDRFILTNESTCPLTSAVTIDLSETVGGLIFDVTGAGAGVEVFQPFEVVTGAEYLPSVPEVVDGQNQVTLEIVDLAAGAQIVVTTDLDDTIGAREITVRGGEIDGALVKVAQGGAETDALFGADVSALVALRPCAA